MVRPIKEPAATAFPANIDLILLGWILEDYKDHPRLCVSTMHL